MPEIALRLEALTKYYGSLAAVKDLTVDVFEGEVFGLLGPNGAGKTTSINMICGLLKPDAGKVLHHGRLTMVTDPRVRTRIGVCPQNIVLWGHLTCLEQLQFIGEMYGLEAAQARSRSERLLKELDLAEKRDRPARTLSGGMQRRLNLAMALVHDPELLVLDEPEAGLDPQSRILVREYLKSLARHKTIILTTHNMDEAERMADRVAILDHGQLLKVDTVDALKRTAGEGDVLEIEFPADMLPKAKSIARSLVPTISSTDHTLVLRALSVVTLLPKLLETFREAGIQPGEIRLRENTLEDVFISLTGRRLRE